MILVIGARSKIGRALIDELLAEGEAVRAFVRDTEPAGSLPGGLEVVVGDLADVDSLRRAVAGAERMFLLCGPTEHEVRFNRQAIDVAAESAVRLLVRSSILGADPDSSARFLRDHGLCDRYLEQSGAQFAIVRPNSFMQNVPESTIPSINEEGRFYASTGRARISMVDVRDVAAVAARLLTRPAHTGRAYDVTGPEPLSVSDVAQKLSAWLGGTVTYLDASDDATRGMLEGYGLLGWLIEGMVELFADYRRSGANGYAAQVTDTVARLTGRQPRTLDQLLAELPGATAAERTVA
jgi:uncharacterized protein YbjT (DUF2867 family)